MVFVLYGFCFLVGGRFIASTHPYEAKPVGFASRAKLRFALGSGPLDVGAVVAVGHGVVLVVLSPKEAGRTLSDLVMWRTESWETWRLDAGLSY